MPRLPATTILLAALVLASCAGDGPQTSSNSRTTDADIFAAQNNGPTSSQLDEITPTAEVRFR